MKLKGNILKMKGALNEGAPVDYSLPIGEELLPLNQFIGKKIAMKYDGVINCIHTGKKIKKSYNQGHSYEAFIKLASCDMCIMKPELCHFHKGTCREPEWGEKNCFQPHVVYIANTSELKVGITRKSQIPTRWIDQGAVEALPIVQVENRFLSGQIEVELAREFADKTNWRNMLKGKKADIDLEEIKEQIFEEYADLMDDMGADEYESDVVSIEFPVLEYPEKIKSLSFDKLELVEGTLQGIKGQYLILDNGVINMRKHQGYEIEFEA